MAIDVTQSDGRLVAKGRGGISATLIAASVSEHRVPIYTVQLRYPRFILAEVNTHRSLSRNSASSRAIPVAKMIEQVRTDPAMPIHWGMNQPGMQASEELKGDKLSSTRHAWFVASKLAADQATLMTDYGAHKQVANRILEPFQFMQTIVTATEWDNFFELRCHPDAQPEFQELAKCIHAVVKDGQCAKRESYPENQDSWHLPYVSDVERSTYNLQALIAASAARCARVSYLTHDGKAPKVSDDIKLFARLVGSTPLHASPIEHQAYPIEAGLKSNNFRGWRQFRQIYCQQEFAELIASVEQKGNS